MKGKLLSAYKEFLDIKEIIPILGQLADCNWYKFPDQTHPVWIPYDLMLIEFARTIANTINDFERYITNLEAWKIVINGKETDIKNEIIIEIIDPFATLAINMPYVIRSRFIYSIAHLCHQANQTKKKDWVDDLPLDKDIQFNDTDNYCVLWKGYNKLKKALEKIDNNEYREKTYDFRNKYNHRISPNIELAGTELVKRKVENGKVTYMIGHTPPLKIDQLLNALKEQYSNCIRAFDEYKKLIYEHISAIEGALSRS
jgi:hypothetical protein